MYTLYHQFSYPYDPLSEMLQYKLHIFRVYVMYIVVSLMVYHFHKYKHFAYILWYYLKHLLLPIYLINEKKQRMMHIFIYHFLSTMYLIMQYHFNMYKHFKHKVYSLSEIMYYNLYIFKVYVKYNKDLQLVFHLHKYKHLLNTY